MPPFSFLWTLTRSTPGYVSRTTSAVRSDDPSSMTMMSASSVDASSVSTVLQITASSLYAGTRTATPAGGRHPVSRRRRDLRFWTQAPRTIRPRRTIPSAAVLIATTGTASANQAAART